MTTPAHVPSPTDWYGFQLPAPPSGTRGDYQDLRSSGSWALGLLAATCVVSVADVAVQVANVRLIEGVLAGGALTDEAVAASMLQLLVVQGASGLVLLPTGIVFIVWFHRSYANLPAFGATPRFGTGWAVGGWLVPVVHLFRPKQIADELWRGSQGGRPAGEGPRGLMPVHSWWALWLASSLVMLIALFAGGSTDLATATDLERVQAGAAWSALASVITVGAGLAAMRFVHHVTSWQEREAGRLRGYEPRTPILSRWPVVALTSATALLLLFLLWAMRPSALSEDFVRTIVAGGDESAPADSEPAQAPELEAAVAEPRARPVEPDPEPPEPSAEEILETIWPEELRVGDCFDEVLDEAGDDEWIDEVLPIPCELPHPFELFAVVELDDEHGAAYPGDEEVGNRGQDACVEPFDSYVGTSYEESRLWLWVIYPGPDDWRKGDREILCVLDADGELLEGSMAGTGN